LRNEGTEVAVAANTQHLLNVVDADGSCNVVGGM
jgi:hypothetical protein